MQLTSRSEAGEEAVLLNGRDRLAPMAKGLGGSIFTKRQIRVYLWAPHCFYTPWFMHVEARSCCISPKLPPLLVTRCNHFSSHLLPQVQLLERPSST